MRRSSWQTRLSGWAGDLPSPSSRSLPRSLILIFASALVFYSLWLLVHPPGFESGETPHWWPIILNVAHGRGYAGCFPEYFPFCRSGEQPTASREPAPVLLFGGIAWLSGDSLGAATVMEVFINLTILVVLFSLAREVTGERVAIVASILWLFYLPALKLIPQVSGDLLATLGVVSGLYFYLRGHRTGLLRHDAVAGMCLALAGLSRSATLFLFPVLIVGRVLWRGSPPARRLRQCLVLSGTFAAMLLPWAIRNHQVFGRAFVTSTLSGYNLYRENYHLAQEDFLRFVAGDEARDAVQSLLSRRHDLKGSENEAEMEAVYRREALRIIRHSPRRYLLLSGYRFGLLWFGWGYLEAYGLRPRLEDYLLMAEQGLLLLLGVVGLYALGLRAWPLAASIAILCVLHMAVVSQLRFIVPVMPLTITLSAAGLIFLMTRRRRTPAAGPS